MKIVTISGACKDVGKTNLAVSIIKRIKGLAALKYSLHYPGNGTGVITDPEILDKHGTDTSKFLKAGANPVFWVCTNGGQLELDLKKALSLLPPGSNVIIEGNSVLNYLKPAFAVFIMNSCWDRVKPSAIEAMARANVIIEYSKNKDIRTKIFNINAGARMLTFDPNKAGGEDFKLLLEDLRNVWREDMEERIQQVVREMSREGKISCHNARKIAEELAVPYHMVGKAADELKVKIFQCELGCF